MTRKIIPNIIKLYETPSENYMFNSCMRSAMAALNENDAFDFMFFAGVTGDLFTQTWSEPKWQYNNEYSFACRDTQVPIQAAFDACGYEYEYIYEADIQKNKSSYTKKIVDSIDKGYPVLTFGIVGPPCCSIICGYDDNGDILIGYSQFTDEPKEDNPMDLVCSDSYFQVRNGLEKSTALIFIGRKKIAPSVADSIRNSLLNIYKLASLPSADNICFGKQAFDAWAESLLCDEYFKDESMLARPLDTYGSCMVMLGTNMYYIQEYLHKSLELCPDMKDQIEKLQRAYQKVNEELQELVEFQGGYFFDNDRKTLLNKEFRNNLAKKIREIGQYYSDAADGA